MSDPAVLPHSSLSEYFHDVVSGALRNQGVVTSAHAEFYLVNLLSEYSHAALDDEPLTLQFVEAQASEPPLRQRKLRAVGDRSLYTTGFFAESLESKAIDVEYYITLGGSAYGTLSRSQTAAPWGETFNELSVKFRQLVEVLCEVSAHTPLSRDTDVLRLYERYVRTGSAFTARRLRKLGLGVLPRGDKGGGSA